MSEETLNQAEVKEQAFPTENQTSLSTEPPVEAVAEQSSENATVPSEAPQNAESTEESTPDYATRETQPQIIIQKERGFSHYVGFALLCVLSVCFFFLPGILVTFGVSRIVDLNAAAAWIFSTILSAVVWLIFKLKIKGFKKSFLFYIALCVVLLLAMVAIQVGFEYNIFAEIFSLLSGAKG